MQMTEMADAEAGDLEDKDRVAILDHLPAGIVHEVAANIGGHIADKSVTDALAKADAVATKEIPKTEAKNYFDRAEKYAKEHPEDYEQISVHYFEVAERFVGTDVSLAAQKLSLDAQQREMQRIKQEHDAERSTLFTRSEVAAASAAHATVPTADALPESLQTQAATTSLFAWLAVAPPPSS